MKNDVDKRRKASEFEKRLAYKKNVRSLLVNKK
jgi:hypothetical protein